MLVQINGEIREIPARMTIAGLVEHLGLLPERLAVELNHAVIRRANWAEQTLSENDRLEIIHFVGGGAGDSGWAQQDNIEAVSNVEAGVILSNSPQAV